MHKLNVFKCAGSERIRVLLQERPKDPMSGLSSGAIVGIVLGIIGFVLIKAGETVFLLKNNAVVQICAIKSQRLQSAYMPSSEMPNALQY